MNYSSEQSQIKTVMHEIGHMFYMPDHYGGSTKTTSQMNIENNTDVFKEACIFGEKRNDQQVLENYTICEGCLSFLQKNINRFSN